MYKLLGFCFTIADRRGAGGINIVCIYQCPLLHTIWIRSKNNSCLGLWNFPFHNTWQCKHIEKVVRTVLLISCPDKNFIYTLAMHKWLFTLEFSLYIYSSFLFVCFSGMYVCPSKMIDSLENLCHFTTVCKLFPQLSNGNHPSGWL